ncbi:hypothetical protein B0T24DRAFT_724801 [Lasiosphaeria ovina]|uniref:DUF6546 domain-containing protein n=1 Tax=Lasiosphaeria ovina TaxID=92902 RepID=A0AAE0MZ11_9PEZI|nr:hypothetical protein B0T24DRAFT_724801 [Lasiosphaeria ovina]
MPHTRSKNEYWTRLTSLLIHRTTKMERTADAKVGWNSLPAELRLAILSLVPFRPILRFRNRSLRRKSVFFATVCEEWRLVFERRNFRRLVLDPTRDLPEFKRILLRPGRRSAVRHIWLNVKLSKYSCNNCGRVESLPVRRQNARTFTHDLEKLMQVLDSSGPGSDWNPNGIVLELSVHSESDARHHFREINTNAYIYPHAQDEECGYDEYHYREERDSTVYSGDYENHGWHWDSRDRRSIKRAPQYAQRVTSGIARLVPMGFPETPISLSEAHMVRELLVRRQFLRRIEFGALAEIMARLVRLERVTLERWRSAAPAPPPKSQLSRAEEQELNAQLQYTYLFFRAARSLKSLSLFEDHSDLVHRLTGAPTPTWRDARAAGIAADETHGLEHFAATFAIDAADFLRDFSPDAPAPTADTLWWRQCPTDIGRLMFREAAQWMSHEALEAKIAVSRPQWPRLRTLALTSADLCPPPRDATPAAKAEAEARMDKLLVAAARAAAQAMPALDTLELWNGGKGHACVFRYSRCGGGEYQRLPVVTLQNTWGGELRQDVVDAWEAVADVERGIVVEVAQLDSARFKTHGSVLGLLDLRRLVVHPMSQCQLEWEAKNGVWGRGKNKRRRSGLICMSRRIYFGFEICNVFAWLR